MSRAMRSARKICPMAFGQQVGLPTARIQGTLDLMSDRVPHTTRPNQGAPANRHQRRASSIAAVVSAALSRPLLAQRPFHRWLGFVLDAELGWRSLSLCR